jgi:hypothetical protein
MRYSIVINFENIPENTYCVDLQVSDGKGNLSNKLSDFCITKKEELAQGFMISPGKQTILVGEVPEPIVVTGAESAVFSLNSGQTGIKKQGCQNGTALCQLSAPLKPGKVIVTISGMNGQYVFWSTITVEPNPNDQESEQEEKKVRRKRKHLLNKNQEILKFRFKQTKKLRDQEMLSHIPLPLRMLGTLKSAVKIVNSFNPEQLEILNVPRSCKK